MAVKQVTCILIGGPAHGERQVFEHSIEKPFPNRITVKLPPKINGTGNLLAFYQTQGLTVDEVPAVVAVHDGLNPQQAWPIAIFEVKRYRDEQALEAEPS